VHPGRVPTFDFSHVVVVVPARNEEDSIVQCLQSLRAARRELHDDVTCTVTVVADRCADRTVRYALRELIDPGDIVLESTVGSVGAARQLGTECALLDVALPLHRVWIANTDADTVVSRDWLTTHLDVARSGAVGVAGVVELRRDRPCGVTLRESFERSYRRAADGSHPHVHGANLGCRADAFRAVGGWNPLRTGEDHDLWARLARYGPVESTTASSVATSARTTGRAPAGFAADLAALDYEIGTVA